MEQLVLCPESEGATGQVTSSRIFWYQDVLIIQVWGLKK